MKKQLNPLVEFGLIALLLVAVVVFVWNVDFSFGGKTTTEKKDEKQEQTTVKDSPEAAAWKEGKDLFKSNCAACHNPKAEGTGPALTGVTARWKAAGEYQGKTGEQWMHEWIRNWNEPVNAGYKYAIDMANSRPSQMNVFATLRDEQIDMIMTYVESPEGPATASK